MIVAEIRRYVERAPRGTAKRLAEAAGMDHAGFSNRIHEQRGMRFNYEQLGAIADAIGAPPGWPLVRWNVGEALATVMRLAGEEGGKAGADALGPAEREAVQAAHAASEPPAVESD